MVYLTIKALHVAAVVVFLGNVTTAALWKLLANRTRNPAVIAYAQLLITRTDQAFTLPGGVILTMSGIFLVLDSGLGWSTPWLVAAILSLLTSTGLWLAVLVPLQVRQHRMADTFAHAKDFAAIPEVYWRRDRVWFRVGLLATLLPYLNVWLMVAKP